MKWAVVTLNRQSIKLARTLKENTVSDIDIYTLEKYMEDGLRPIENGLKNFNEVLFNEYKVIVYIMAMGIIVRDIAPYMKHKSVDPAIICLSVDGNYVIPVLSGHLGGANKIAIDIAESIDAKPVITTASDILNKKAVDMFAMENNLEIASFEMAKDITAMMINDEQVDIISQNPIEGVKTLKKVSEKTEGAIIISYKTDLMYKLPFVQLIPKQLVIGIGARRDTPLLSIENLLNKIFSNNNLSVEAIKKIASIDIKKDEQGIIELADKLDVPFITYSAETLSEVADKFEISDFVKKITGVGAVCMPSGYIASNSGKCLVKKVAHEGITISIWEEI